MVSTLPALHGGRPSLDFVNTVDPREPPGEDFLPDYPSLLAWAAHARLLSNDQLARARARAQASPAEAAWTHKQAIELREALYPVFCAAAEHQPPPQPAAGHLTTLVAQLQPPRQLTWAGQSWGWAQTPRSELDLPVLAILDDALQLLLSASRLVKCNGQECGWLFIDTSKNHSRRWCSMAGCGNRAKTRRHLQRKQAGTSHLRPAGQPRPASTT